MINSDGCMTEVNANAFARHIQNKALILTSSHNESAQLARVFFKGGCSLGRGGTLNL